MLHFPFGSSWKLMVWNVLVWMCLHEQNQNPHRNPGLWSCVMKTLAETQGARTCVHGALCGLCQTRSSKFKSSSQSSWYKSQSRSQNIQCQQHLQYGKPQFSWNLIYFVHLPVSSFCFPSTVGPGASAICSYTSQQIMSHEIIFLIPLPSRKEDKGSKSLDWILQSRQCAVRKPCQCFFPTLSSWLKWMEEKTAHLPQLSSMSCCLCGLS